VHLELPMDKKQIDGDRVFLIRGFLTPEECHAFVTRSERAGYEEATITTAAGPVMAKEIRDNARLIVDDTSLADNWWQRVGTFLPQRLQGCQILGFNERFRFYRYDVGQKFAPHVDGAFRRNNGDRSQLTFMVYLNSDFSGGETKFYDEKQEVRVAVQPERGTALVFEHLQLHEGAAVVGGRKYVLRTDVMYSTPARR
jgi:predicted 2-oxoglutarate/Fe(II)-dependent dioxygenase YbiX